MASELPLSARLLCRFIPPEDREAIVGDLVEDAACRGLGGRRRGAWLTAECLAIAGGLSVQRVRAWLVMPPIHELAAGLALDGRGAFRGADATGTLLRVVIFCGSVATLAWGVEVLVRNLLLASGL